MAIASCCEESLIIFFFVKRKIWTFFLHKSNERVEFFMADISHRTIQSPIPDIVSFLQGTGSCIGYCSSVAKMYQNLDECFTGVCCINNERPRPS